MRKHKYIISVLLILLVGAAALTIGAHTVERTMSGRITFEPSSVEAPQQQEETLAFASMVFTQEEADERLNRLREEPVIHAKAKASYVSRVDVNTDVENAYFLACAVCREAGGEDTHIMMLVANVIMNRVESVLYPSTIYGVLTQPYQYGTMWRDGISFPSWATAEIQASCYDVAYRILSGERVCPSSVVYQAEFLQGSGIYAYFPGFYFCYQ